MRLRIGWKGVGTVMASLRSNDKQTKHYDRQKHALTWHPFAPQQFTTPLKHYSSMEAPNPEFMREAIRLSIEKMQAGFGGPFGAVVVKDGEIIARGFNQVTTTHDPTCHAEVDAIRKACQALGTFQLDGCDLYTSCEPCPMCLGAIYWARPARVFYGNTKQDAAAIGFDDHFIYDEIDKPLSERSISMQQLLPEEALAGFKAWEQHESKKVY